MRNTTITATMPLKKKVIPCLIANDVVGVQPMGAPSGNIWGQKSMLKINFKEPRHLRRMRREHQVIVMQLKDDVLSPERIRELKKKRNKLKNAIRWHKKRYVEEYI